MPKDSHKKIALVTISLAGGGAERSTALLSKALTKKGFDIHIVLLDNAIDFEYDGTIFNLGVYKNGHDTILKRLSRFQKLKRFLKKEKFDLIIDVRSRGSSYKEAYYLNYLYRNESIVYMVHSSRLETYFPLHTFIVNKMIARSKGIVGVSKEIAHSVNTTFKTDKCVCIYNATLPNVPISKDVNPVFIWAGRLVDEVKNVSLLLEAFAKAKKANSTYQLHIYGEGPDKEKLLRKAKGLNLLDKVIFKPFTKDIISEMAKARAVLLSSYYEGFPSVLIESLSVGTPVISVNCMSGPKEIIAHQKNGLLVNNHDVSALANAIDLFATDNTLYEKCKNNAVASVSHLTLDVIGDQWNDYIKSL